MSETYGYKVRDLLPDRFDGMDAVVASEMKDGKDGYAAIQLGFEEMSAKNGGKGDARLNKPMMGHFKKHGGQAFRVLREVRTDGVKASPEAGAVLKVDIFANGVKAAHCSPHVTPCRK